MVRMVKSEGFTFALVLASLVLLIVGSIATGLVGTYQESGRDSSVGTYQADTIYPDDVFPRVQVFEDGSALAHLPDGVVLKLSACDDGWVVGDGVGC